MIRSIVSADINIKGQYCLSYDILIYIQPVKIMCPLPRIECLLIG